VANEALAWPNPTPALTDNADGTQTYQMGVAFTVDADQSCVGVQWRVPDTVSPPAGGVHAAGLFNSDTNDKLGYKEFTPVPGGYQDILFDTPVDLVPGVTYAASIYTLHYVFRASNPSGVSTPSGSATATEGRLEGDNGGAATADTPSGVTTATFYISPLIAGAAAPASGDAALGLDLGVAAAGGRPSAGTANGTTLDLAVSATGGRPSTGVASVTLDLALAAQGGRPSAGTSALGLDLAIAATGARPSGGMAALGLGLALAAAGEVPTPGGAAALGLNLVLVAAGGERSRSDQPRILTMGPPGRIESTTRIVPVEV
jgi:hypothetical protein